MQAQQDTEEMSSYTFLSLTISTGGYPIASGESLTAKSNIRPMLTPTIPGAHIPAWSANFQTDFAVSHAVLILNSYAWIGRGCNEQRMNPSTITKPSNHYHHLGDPMG